MPFRRLVAYAVGASLLSAHPSFAGSCSAELETAQAQIDAYLEGQALTGRWTQESRRALMHRQPTPATIAAAEERLGEVDAPEFDAVERAMTMAREYDSVGATSLCTRALSDVESAICSLRPGSTLVCP
jgi:hypothetical protein